MYWRSNEPKWQRLRMREGGILAGVVVYLGQRWRRLKNLAEQTGGNRRKDPDQQAQHANLFYRCGEIRRIGSVLRDPASVLESYL
jgi:hypothetical protein